MNNKVANHIALIYVICHASCVCVLGWGSSKHIIREKESCFIGCMKTCKKERSQGFLEFFLSPAFCFKLVSLFFAFISKAFPFFLKQTKNGRLSTSACGIRAT